MNKSQAASLGGKAVYQKYGSEYMSRIGTNGANAFWKKYTVEPVLLSRWAIVNRETKEVVAIIGDHNYKKG